MIDGVLTEPEIVTFVLVTFVPVKAFLSLKTTAVPSEYVAVLERLLAQLAVVLFHVPLVAPVQEMLLEVPVVTAIPDG